MGLEKLVGAWLYAGIGAIIVVIAVALGLKYAIAEGFIHVSNTGRCIGAAVFGLILIAGGEVARRKINTHASVGLTGAGIAVMYAAAYAAYGFYKLIPTPVAFVLLASVSLLGIALAGRARSAPLAIIALLGAYVVPMLMGKASAEPLVLPSYLIALMALGLGLSAWKPVPFSLLRRVAWVGTALEGTLWLVFAGFEHDLHACGFTFIVWAMVHGEFLLAARTPAAKDQLETGLSLSPSGFRRAVPLTMSLSTTAWAAGMSILAIQVAPSLPGLSTWMPPALYFILTAISGMMLAGHISFLTQPPRTDSERLGAVLWLQASALLIATVALALSDATQVIAWLAMGLASVAAGRWMRTLKLDVYGLVVLTIAAGRLLLWDSWRAGSVGGQPLLGLWTNQWSLMMLLGSAAWFGTAALLRHAPIEVEARWRRNLTDSAIVVGLSLLAILSLHPKGGALPVTCAVALVALAAAWIARLRHSAILVVYCLGVLVLSTMRVVALAPFHAESTAGQSIAGLWINAWSLMLLASASAWLGVSAILNRASAPTLARGFVDVLAAIGFTLLAGVAIHTKSDALPMTCTIGAISVLVLWLAAMRSSTILSVHALLVYLAALLFWGVGYAIDYLDDKHAPLMHPAILAAAALTALAIVNALRIRSSRLAQDAAKPLCIMFAAIAAAFWLAWTSMEIARSVTIWIPKDTTAQSAAVSIWWAVFAVIMIITGFVRNFAIVRHIGLGLLGVAAFKTVLWDLRDVSAPARIVALLVVGLLMLAVAIGYAKVSARLGKKSGALAERENGDAPST